jgi:hypothetical protein
MGFTGMKYRFSACFHREQTFSVKLKANPFGFLGETQYFSKLVKNYIQH